MIAAMVPTLLVFSGGVLAFFITLALEPKPALLAGEAMVTALGALALFRLNRNW